ncbi:MAG: NAD(P)-dependent oxidoreductase [Phycisphaerae bacterium]|jgi:nucleoside-diphosphate-sugar epimerase
MSDPVRDTNVLVTGGSGFVGTAVVAKLLDRGYKVIATSNVLTDSLPHHPNLEWVLWDALQESLPGVEWDTLGVILHLATPERLFDFPEQAVALYELAVASTFHLLESACRHQIGRVLIASTGNVLACGAGIASETDTFYEPSSFYGTTKACAELLTRAYQSQVSAATLRFYHPYGIGKERVLVNRLVQQIAQGKPVFLEGEEGILVNPVWVDDLAEGIYLAVRSSANGIFHLAGPETVSLRQLVQLIASLLHKEAIIQTRPAGPLERHAGSYERAKRILGYNPRIGLREGLLRLIGGRNSDKEVQR